jgi:hypothetical protein
LGRCWSFLHPLQEVFESIEAVVPEGTVKGYPINERSQGAGTSAVMRFPAFMPVSHKLCALQYDQVFRDGRLRDSGVAGQGAYRLLAIPREALEDCPPGRIGKRFKDVIGDSRHGENITNWLWIVNLFM